MEYIPHSRPTARPPDRPKNRPPDLSPIQPYVDPVLDSISEGLTIEWLFGPQARMISARELGAMKAGYAAAATLLIHGRTLTDPDARR